MKITLKLYASLMDCLPPGTRGNVLALEVDNGATVQAVLDRHHVPDKLAKLVLVNGQFIAPTERSGRVLSEGDELAAWPPIAGG